VLDDEERDGVGEVEVRIACRDLVAATRGNDAGAVDRALTRLVEAVPAELDMNMRTTSSLALVECVRARAEMQVGQRGAARLSAAIALALVRRLEGEDAARALGRVLISTARLACDLGDVEVARRRAREALAISQAALGSIDPDTAWAWHVLGQTCQAAGDPVGANAARRQARAAGRPSDGGDVRERLAPEEAWLLCT
jgi:Tetratricopeptide repeat